MIGESGEGGGYKAGSTPRGWDARGDKERGAASALVPPALRAAGGPAGRVAPGHERGARPGRVGSSSSRVPVSDTVAQGAFGAQSPGATPPTPACSARSLPPAPSPSACAAAPSLSPLSSARHGSSKMSAAPRPPLSPARPGAAPLARKISAVCSTAQPTGPAPQQTLTTLKLPPVRQQHHSYQPPALCELL